MRYAAEERRLFCCDAFTLRVDVFAGAVFAIRQLMPLFSAVAAATPHDAAALRHAIRHYALRHDRYTLMPMLLICHAAISPPLLPSFFS